MDIRFAIRALEVPSDEPDWQSILLRKLGLPEDAVSEHGLTKEERPLRHPKPLSPAL